MTDDLISRADAMTYPLSWEHYDKEHGSREFISGVESYREYIEYLPSAQPKQGEWVNHEEPCVNGGYWHYVMCTACKELNITPTNFCPNCGARMNSSEKPNNCGEQTGRRESTDCAWK